MTKKTIGELKKEILDYLCRSSEIDKAMNKVLALVGSYFNVDRAYVFENSQDGLFCSNTYEWCSDGIEPEIANLQNVSYLDDVGCMWKDNFDSNGIYFCKSVSDLPEKQKAILEPQNILSMLQCAIMVKGEFIGYIGFDNCTQRMAGWETNSDAVETLVYISHLLTLYLIDYRQKTDALAIEEQRVEQANDMFDDLLVNVDCGMAICRISPTGEHELKYVNNKLCSFAGVGKDEFFKKYKEDAFFIVAPQYKEKVKEAYQKLLLEHRPQNIVFRPAFNGGKNMWITFSVSCCEKNDGSLRTYMTFFDSTNEVEASRELRKKYEFEKNNVHNDKSRIAYAVFNLSKSLTLEMERRFPLNPLENMISLDEFRDDIAAAVYSEDQRKEFVEMFNVGHLVENHNVGTDEQTIEFQRTLPSGKVIWVKSIFRIIMEPEGTDLLLFYYCNDINKNKSFEIMTSYLANEEYDMIGCVNFYDDTAIMLYGQNSVRKLTDADDITVEEDYSKALEWFVNNAIVPEEREQFSIKLFIDKIKNALKINNTYEFTIHTIGEAGKRLTKKIKYISFDADRNLCLFTQVDITQLISAEEKKQRRLSQALEAANKAGSAKSEFLSKMSHEIRTPMNGIIGMTKLAEDSAKDPKTKEYLKQIDESSQYMLGLLNDVLDMSRIESGGFELNLEWVKSTDTLWSCIHMIEPMMLTKGIKFIHPDTSRQSKAEFLVDPMRTKQVVMNLLNNAYKFTPEGGTVELLVKNIENDNDTAVDELIIRDTGCGMSEEFLKKGIFKSFSQEQNSFSEIIRGTGLGLALVKEIVDKMGGEIRVESELGKGTTFYVTWKYKYRMKTDDFDKAEVEESYNISELRGKKILLVEDHPINRKIGVELLEKVGVIITQAVNGQQAVDIFKDSAPHTFDAVLMDIRMPVMDGNAAAQHIRALDREDALSTPIIAMTANAFDEDIRKSKQSGMNAHLAKPVDPELMYHTIISVINEMKQ